MKEGTWSQCILAQLEVFRGRIWSVALTFTDLVNSLAFSLHMWGRTYMGPKWNCDVCHK